MRKKKKTHQQMLKVWSWASRCEGQLNLSWNTKQSQLLYFYHYLKMTASLFYACKYRTFRLIHPRLVCLFSAFQDFLIVRNFKWTFYCWVPWKKSLWVGTVLRIQMRKLIRWWQFGILVFSCHFLLGLLFWMSMRWLTANFRNI